MAGSSALTPVDHRTLIKIAEHLGFKHRSTTGSHAHYVKAGCLRPLTIPTYREIHDEKIVRSFMKVAGLNRKQFLELKAAHE